MHEIVHQQQFVMLSAKPVKRKKKQHGKYRMNSKNIRSINSSVIARPCVTYAMRTEFLFTQHNGALMLIINFIFVSRSSCETNQMLEKMIFSSYIIYNEQFFPFFFLTKIALRLPTPLPHRLMCIVDAHSNCR